MRRLFFVPLFCAVLLALSIIANSQEPPKAGSYAVPQGWTVETSDARVLLSAPGNQASVYLVIYRNDRAVWQISDQFIYNLTTTPGLTVKASPTEKIWKSGKELRRVIVTTEQKDAHPRRYSVIIMPVEGGHLMFVAMARDAEFAQFADAFDVVLQSVLPGQRAVVTAGVSPCVITRANVGLRVAVPPEWAVEPEMPGENSAVLKIKRGNALLSLSSDVDERSAEEYARFVEAKADEESKQFQKISEAPQVVAGVGGTRLELRTTAAEGVVVRRWIVLFSRENRHYVVAAVAPESEFEGYAADFRKMIESVALAE